ncbi:hypothetical protein [Corynebacterium sp.]|uniref:hypothetical protein n=1 Tax=Corynebacterium sp. TaxID=1720 RepID=UPI0026DCD232|nr:hypothetical protein [Corynebacterium sp.]MDO5077291.1 hypothetical protein [Corynebacterium sp.]
MSTFDTANMGGAEAHALRFWLAKQARCFILGIDMRLNVPTEAAKGRLHRLAAMGSTALQNAM